MTKLLEITVLVEDYECSNTLIVEGNDADIKILQQILNKSPEVTFTKINNEQ